MTKRTVLAHFFLVSPLDANPSPVDEVYVSSREDDRASEVAAATVLAVRAAEIVKAVKMIERGERAMKAARGRLRWRQGWRW